MDSDVSTAVLSMLTTFKNDALEMFASMIPIIGAVIITVGVATFIINWFRGHMHR